MDKLEDRLEVLEKFFPVKRLKKIGGSYALFLPKEWIDSYCDPVGIEDYFVLMALKEGSITISALSEKEVMEFARNLQKVA